MTKAEALRSVAKMLRHPWQRLEDGRGVVVAAVPLEVLELAANVLNDSAKTIDSGPALVEPRR